MDSHDRHCRLLAAFLAGELNPADARRWDEHLLECERCWRAVREDRVGRQAAQLLRQPAPPGLADRVAFAVELGAAGTIEQQRPRYRMRLGWRWLAGAGAVAAAVAAAVALLLPGGRETGSMPAAVAAVARYAETMPPAQGQGPGHGGQAVPVEVGHPVTVSAGGQRMVLRTWRLGRVEAVVAVSAQPFGMPARARGMAGPGMAWTVRLGNIGLYCRNGHTSELVAAPVPDAQLAALATRLPPA
jgi:anti-sigma factor RsiW